MTHKPDRLYLFIIPLLVLCALPLRIYAQEKSEAVIINSTVSDVSGLIGDKRHLRIIVEYPGEWDSLGVQPVNWGQDVHVYNVKLDKSPVDDDAARKTIVYNVEFSLFDSGDIELPEVVFGFKIDKDRIASFIYGPVSLRPGSLVGEDDQDIKDIKGPMTVEDESNSLFTLILLVGIALIIILAAALLFLRRKFRNGNGEDELDPAHIEAYRALDRLSKENLLADGFYKAYYVKLTEIVKRYLGRRYESDMLEKTTFEINREIPKLDISREVRNRLSEFFNESDLVKFAKYIPTGSQARESLESAYYIVDTTREETLIPSEESPVEEKHPTVNMGSK